MIELSYKWIVIVMENPLNKCMKLDDEFTFGARVLACVV